MLRKQLTDKQHMILSVHTLWLRLHIHHLIAPGSITQQREPTERANRNEGFSHSAMSCISKWLLDSVATGEENHT